MCIVVLCCLSLYQYYWPRNNWKHDGITPSIRFHIYHIIGRCTSHVRIPLKDKKICYICEQEYLPDNSTKIYTRKELVMTETTVSDFHVFQWNSTMRSTTSNDVVDVKPNWGCFFDMFYSCFLVRNIDTRTVSTAPQYTFPVWQCMLRMRICAHCSIFHIWCFGINMTPMWNQCIFICCIYVVCFLSRPSALSILALILQFLKYLSRQDSNDTCILLAEMKHSKPHIIL